MPQGRFTSTTTKTTAALLAASLVDPTLICLTSALAIAPVAAGGLAYHAAKKGFEHGKSVYVARKEKKAAAATDAGSARDVDLVAHDGDDVKLEKRSGELMEKTSGQVMATTSEEATSGTDGEMQQAEAEHTQPTPAQLVEYEACVRKIASAATGIAIQGAMTPLLPHLSVVVAVNSVDLVTAVKQLRKLRKQDVHRAVGGLNKTEHVVVGVVMKMVATGLTLGHADFVTVDGFMEGGAERVHEWIGKGLSEDEWVKRVEELFGGKDSVGLHIEGVSLAEGITPDGGGASGLVETDAVQMHQEILEHHGIHEINAAANYAPDEIERYLGLGEEWRSDEFAGTERHSGLTNVAVVGTVAAGMDVAITKVLEEPVHEVIDKAELARLARGGLREQKVEGEGKLLEMVVDRGLKQKDQSKHGIRRKEVPPALPPRP